MTYVHPKAVDKAGIMTQEELLQGKEVPVVYVHLGDEMKWSYSLQPPAEIENLNSDAAKLGGGAGAPKAASKAGAKSKAGAGGTKDKEKEKDVFGVKSVSIRSGDVIVFGGKSRELYHGIQDMEARSSLLNGLASPGVLSMVLK